MGLYKRNPTLVEAHQWYRNGDHPKDGKNPCDEGKVVRFFRHPTVPGDHKCEHCKHMMHFHGFIDLGRTGHLVCPGDWIINEVGKENFFPVKDHLFHHMYSGTMEPTDFFNDRETYNNGTNAENGDSPAD